MPEIVVTTRTPVKVDKSIEQLEQELCPDGNIDWRVVADAYRAQFPKNATMTYEEGRMLQQTQFNRAMIDEFLPYMRKRGHRVTGLRTTCGEEITRDIDGYVELACDGANPVQDHWVTMNIDGDKWDLHFVEYSYETDDKTQMSSISIQKNGETLMSVDADLAYCQEWDRLIRVCRQALQMPSETDDNFVHLNDEPAYFSTTYRNKMAITIAALILHYN